MREAGEIMRRQIFTVARHEYVKEREAVERVKRAHIVGAAPQREGTNAREGRKASVRCWLWEKRHGQQPVVREPFTDAHKLERGEVLEEGGKALYMRFSERAVVLTEHHDVDEWRDAWIRVEQRHELVEVLYTGEMDAAKGHWTTRRRICFYCCRLYP